MIRYSRQREAIKNQLSDRYDHPTAETIYAELKKEYPNLSVATVYRNLKQLEEWGEIVSITTDGATRYDYNISPHSHFFCRKCGSVLDIKDNVEEVKNIAQSGFDGTIESCSTCYYGICPECAGKEKN